MAASASPPPKEEPVRVSRTFEASRQRVYKAWTDPELLIRWFVDDDGEMQVRELDLRVGGRWRFEGTMKGQRWTLQGVFEEVRPPEKLVYTWTWTWSEDSVMGEAGNTTVTVEFRERGRATEVTVTQTGFPNARSRQEHNAGWVGCLDRLGGLVVSERSTP